MKRYVPFIIIAAVALLTIGGGAMLYRVKQRGGAISGTHISGTAGAVPEHVRGAANAPVTLEEFADFQCPACATTAMMLGALESAYGSRLRMIFWNFPLAMHQHGRDAALAAEAASSQNRFWEMHDLLYQNQSAWSTAPDTRPSFEKYAEQLHLDVDRFKKDCASEEVAARVDRQRNEGVARGVRNTPTIFINNREVVPPFSPERLREAVEAAMPGHKTPKP
jgi:protein-disulfide isomerase